MAKYKKVDANTIQVITEKKVNIDLAGLIKGKEALEKQLEELTKRLKGVNEVITKAKELGIVPKEKDKNPEKGK